MELQPNNIEQEDEKKFYTFDDLNFKKEGLFPKARLQFKNGWGAAVVKIDDNYVVTVLDEKGELNYSTDITFEALRTDDINELNEIMQNIQKLGPDGKLPAEQTAEATKPAQNTGRQSSSPSASEKNPMLTRIEMSRVTMVREQVKNQEISEAQAIELMQKRSKETQDSIIIIACVMVTENMVVQPQGTDASLVPAAAQVYKNALQNPACNQDVIDVTKDSIESITQSTPEKELEKVKNLLQEALKEIEQLQKELDKDKNQNSSGSREIPGGSRPAVCTMYGATLSRGVRVPTQWTITPPWGNAEIPQGAVIRNCTKYGVTLDKDNTITKRGHILFKTPDNKYMVVPQSQIPDKYFDKAGKIIETEVSETITLEPKKQPQKNKNKINQITKEVARQGNSK